MTRTNSSMLITANEGASGAWPPEVGPLKRDGKRLVDAAGRTWFGRGLTMFLLYARYLRGESIQRQLEWCREVGANYLRIFGPVPCPPWDQEWAFYQTLVLDQAKLRAFANALANVGLRMEWVPICGPWPLQSSRLYLDSSYSSIAGCWNAFIECTNEPGQSGTYHGDLHQLIDGIDRRGVLSATGAAWLLGPPNYDTYAKCHWLDYGTPHTQRDGHYAHDGKECLEWRDGGEGAPGQPNIPGSGCPEWDDEPRRIDENPTPALNPDKIPGWGDMSPAQQQEWMLDEVLSHYATSGLFAGASLLHIDSGKFGLDPPPSGWQDRVCREVAKLWAWFPADTSYGQYSRPGFGPFPIEWQQDVDSLVNHAYCQWVGDVGYGVNCVPPAGRRPVAKSGFEIVEYGPRPFIFKARRL